MRVFDSALGGTWSRLRGANGQHPYRSEAVALTRMAAPLVGATLVAMGISVTDVVMMGWLGPTALGAGAIAGDVFFLLHCFCAGMLAPIGTMVASARGAGDKAAENAAIRDGFMLAVLLALPAAAMVWHAGPAMAALGIDPALAETADPYAQMMALAFLPMNGVLVWRNVLVAQERPRIVLLTTVLALPLNAALNYLLMFGGWGVPALGLAGAGIASALTATAMLLVMSCCAGGIARGGAGDCCFVRIVRHGLPVAIRNVSEVGLFVSATVVMGLIDATALAAHAVVLRVANVLYSLPMGLAQAATVRVAEAVGAGNCDGARTAARAALALSAALGLVAWLVVWALCGELPWLFLDTSAPGAQRTAALAALFLAVLGFIQIAEGPGVVAQGILRGYRDDRTPMLQATAGYWLVGFAAAMVLAIPLGYGGIGIWFGLAAGTLAVGLAGTVRFLRHDARSTDCGCQES